MSCITLKGILLLDPNSGDLTSSTHTKTALTLCMMGNFSCFGCPLLTFFFKLTFSQFLSGILSECQTVWIQIRTYILTVLIRVNTVCKGYQQRQESPLSRKELKAIFFCHECIPWCPAFFQANSQGCDKPAQVCRLITAFAFCKYEKAPFKMCNTAQT